MAAAAIAVAKFASAAFASATTAVASGLTAMGMSAATATAVATQVVTTAATIAVTTGISYLLRPSTPSSGLTLDFKPDPKAPVTGMMGYAATGGNKVFQSTWGYNNVVLSLGAALSLGPIDAITQFRADDKVVAFTGAQNEAVGFYDDDMWQKTTLGLPTDAALLPPTGLKYGSPGLSGWGANNAAKGVAFAFWTMVLAKKPEDRNIFVNGVPDPRWIGRWMKLYDWRKDSTYPGGSGSHRENDWRTWEFTENPYVHARAWLRGHHKLNDDGTVDFTKRIAGVGVNPAAIDMPAFNEGANVSDANGWKISGSWSSSDSKWDVLVSMLKAGSGAPQQNGAMISVLVNTPRVSTETVTRDNIVGDIQINTMTRRRERKNTIVPRYRSEAHSWEYVPAGSVTSSVYRAEDDNQLRSLEIQYTYVRDAKQAAQLAAYDLANLRESIKVNATLKVDALSIRAGDCITFNVPEVGLENQKCIVIRKTTDYQTAMVTVECRSETDGKHAWALGQAANPPPTPSLSANDPLYMPPPLAIDWTVTPQPPSGGTSQPIINVDGPIDRGDIAAIIVEYGLSATGPWLSAGPADPATGKYQISGLNPGASYWVSIRYVANNGIISERYVTGPHVAPSLVADIDPSNPTLTNLENQIDELFDTTAIIEGDLNAAEAVIASTTAEVVAARQGSPNLAANITGVKTTISNEATTRATEINRVEAVADLAYIDVAPARFQNLTAWTGTLGGPEIDAADLTGVTFVNDPDMGQSIEGAFVGQTVHMKKNLPTTGRKYRVTISLKVVTAGSQLNMGLRDNRLSVDSTYLTRGNINMPNAVVGQVLTWSTVVDMGARAANTAGTTQVRFGVTLYGTVRLAEFRIQDVTDTESLNASVQTNTIAIVDLEAQRALASYEVVAAASGGRPARLKLVSTSGLGSFVALDAQWIFLGDNTVFDDATDTMQTTVGSNIRVIANGAAFGAAGNLLEWWGPSSVPIGSMTTANGYNGRMTIAPYVFNNAVPDSNITVVSTTGLGSSNGATNAIMVSQSASVKLSPRIKISSSITYDGGSQMTGGVFGDFIVEVYEQNSGGVTVLQSTTMNVSGVAGGPVNSLTGGVINTFPAGQVGSKSGAVTYGIRVRRTGGSGNFINLRANLYMEII